jgi:PIN like domain
VETHDDHFSQTTKDPELLHELGQFGWVLITEDEHIRYRPAERDAYIKADLRIFVLIAANLGAEDALRILLSAEPRIRKVLWQDDGPFIYRIGKDGSVVKIQ